jgi:hypothetical protein
VDPKKIEAMKDWPHPKTLKSLWFPGFNGILSQVCSELWKNCNSPHCSLKNNAFSWTPTADQSFQALKEAMCMTLVLAFLDFTKTFFLECDASRKGIGVVLMQMEDLWLSLENNYLSRHLGKSTYEKEMLAILHVVDL